MVRTGELSTGRGSTVGSESAFIHSLNQILDTSSMLIILALSDTKVTEEVKNSGLVEPHTNREQKTMNDTLHNKNVLANQKKKKDKQGTVSLYMRGGGTWQERTFQ